jgi:GTPase SAR1 family protein
VFDGYAVQTEVQGTRVSLDLRDTCGSDDYDRLRPLAYPQTDVFVLCFSLADPERIARVEHKVWPHTCHAWSVSDGEGAQWCAEVRRAVPDARVLLVGTKLDLRADLAKRCVVPRGAALVPVSEAGAQLARRIGAVEYVECSALTQHGKHGVARRNGAHSALLRRGTRVRGGCAREL